MFLMAVWCGLAAASQQQDTTSNASSEAVQHRRPTSYSVTNLSTLGGAVSRGNSINDLIWVSGYSNLPDNQSRHAMLWRYGSARDLRTLGGPNSSVAWPVKNDGGLISGISQTDIPEPRGENWSCSAFFPAATRTGYTCLGFVWDPLNGMRALPTLGGNNGYAAGANNWGQVAGWAENTTPDPTCEPPQVLQFRPVVWGPGRNQIQELPLIAGDTSGAATAINDNGQAVGISGTCDQAVGRDTAAHAVLWENGTVRDIYPEAPAPYWNTPTAINRQGDIVGFVGSPNDRDGNMLTAFLWTSRNGMRILGALPGDVFSEALGINRSGQVVGLSCDVDFNCRPFIWQDGVMTDLNALVAPSYSGVLVYATDINEFGMITGLAFDPGSGNLVAYQAIPRVGGASPAEAGTDKPAARAVLPDSVKREIVLPMDSSRGILARLGLR